LCLPTPAWSATRRAGNPSVSIRPDQPRHDLTGGNYWMPQAMQYMDTADTLLNLDDPNTKVYEAHGALTQEWAQELIAVSASYASVPVAYDRVTGAITHMHAACSRIERDDHTGKGARGSLPSGRPGRQDRPQ
jgi:hypothetical protein